MPAATIRAFQDHGRVDVTLESGLAESRHLFDELSAAGVDYQDVVDTLELEGVVKFVTSFNELLKGIESKRDGLAVAA
jgi:transaldolase